jgi:penicillin-binding protein 2
MNGTKPGRFDMGDFHNPDSEHELFRRRLSAAAILVLVCFLILTGRFLYLQVVQHSYYTTRAEENRISLVPIIPNRGVIVDRNGVILARNYSAFTLEITPGQVADLEETINGLAEIIDIQAKDRKRFKRVLQDAKNFESIPIRARLSDEEVAKFAANRYRFPGVEVQARLFRQYPNGPLASHAIGYIGRINDKDVAWLADQEKTIAYKGTDYIGKTGLEQSYEFELHGQTGYEEVEIDAGGRAIRSLNRRPPISGNNLTLTIDATLQAITEKAFGDRRGSLVAIEPSTGGILALVSMPTYDPNLFVDGITVDNWKELNESDDKPMLNRALNGAYPPGSTFKPFMALAALELGKRTPSQTIFDPGFYNFGNHQFRDDKKGGHGTVNMHRSIVESCDTYYYMLANDLGIDAISKFMGQLGLGQRTGVDIHGESEGVLPSQEWKKKRFKKPEQQKWYAGETISIGIGQGYNAYTPIQLAQAVSTIANNGVMFRPHLVSYITDAKTGEKRIIEPEPLKRLPLKPENIEVIKRAMVDVNKVGTGARAFAGAPYEAAGKTGTAQVYSLKGSDYKAGVVKQNLRDHALFIAFAPVDEPKIAIAILVENGGFGAQSAAPIARMVFDYYLLGKVPPGPANEDVAAIEEDPESDAPGAHQ